MSKKDNGRYRKRNDADELESVYRGMAGGKERSKKSKKSNRGAAIIASCIALVAIGIGIAAGWLFFEKAQMNGMIIHNVTVAGVDVGGMTQAQAIDAVNAKISAYRTTPMVVTVLDSTAQIPTEYVGKLDVKGAVKAAYKFGNSGSQQEREQQQQIARDEGYVVDLAPYLELNTEGIKQVLAQLGTNYNSTLTQSTYEITGTSPEQKLVITLGIPEYGLDLNALYQDVIDAYSRLVFTVEGECGMIEPEPVDLESILNEHYIAPVDATFDPKTFEIVEGKDGYGFDLEDAKKKLQETEYGATLEIPFGPIVPEITANDLSSTLYKDQLSTYTAASSSDPDRDTNLRLACEAINGIVLMPGDVFSYNEALGERTAAKGYRPGRTYVGNETIETVGGGICQVSSTLYYCALVADLEILLRDNHGFATSYMPLGMDATVSWGSLDFRFKNNTDYPIRIEASASGGNTTVTLVGTDNRDYYIKMEYETLNTYEYAISYKTMAANNAEGYKDGDYIVNPYTGYDVKTYRCKYSKETNELLMRNFEDESKYRSRDGVICKIEGGSQSTGNASDIELPGIGGGVVTDGPGALPPE